MEVVSIFIKGDILSDFQVGGSPQFSRGGGFTPNLPHYTTLPLLNGSLRQSIYFFFNVELYTNHGITLYGGGGGRKNVEFNFCFMLTFIRFLRENVNLKVRHQFV